MMKSYGVTMTSCSCIGRYPEYLVERHEFMGYSCTIGSPDIRYLGCTC